MVKIFLSLQFLLTDSKDDLYGKESINSAKPPVLHSGEMLLVLKAAPVTPCTAPEDATGWC